MENATLTVEGMSCAHCVATIETKVAQLPGVGSVHVDLAQGRVQVRFAPERVSLAAVAAAIADEGYVVAAP